MRQKKGDDWFPFWIDKWFFGSTKLEFSPAERSVWIDLIALSKKDGGFIRANINVPYPRKQLAGLFVVPLNLLNRTIDKSLQSNKLELLEDGTLFVVSTEKYAISERHKRRLKADIVSGKTDIASKTAALNIEKNRIEESNKEKEEEKENSITTITEKLPKLTKLWNELFPEQQVKPAQELAVGRNLSQIINTASMGITFEDVLSAVKNLKFVHKTKYCKGRQHNYNLPKFLLNMAGGSQCYLPAYFNIEDFMDSEGEEKYRKFLKSERR